MLKAHLDQDLKTALLAGDKTLATTIRGLKSVILYEEVAKGARDQGLSDDAIVVLFAKEAKKRQESADLYTQGGNGERAAAELAEKMVIEGYLPKQLSDEELTMLVDATVAEMGGASAARSASRRRAHDIFRRTSTARSAAPARDRVPRQTDAYRHRAPRDSW